MNEHSFLADMTLLQTLQFVSVCIVLFGVAYSLIGGAVTLWRRTVGARRVERKMLNRLLIGATVESLQDTLGVPTFRTGSEHGPRQLTWLTPHALAKVCVDDSGAGAAFAVTVLYSKRWQFTLDIHRLSLGVFGSSVKLGQSTFKGLTEPGQAGAVQAFVGPTEWDMPRGTTSGAPADTGTLCSPTPRSVVARFHRFHRLGMTTTRMGLAHGLIRRSCKPGTPSRSIR